MGTRTNTTVPKDPAKVAAVVEDGAIAATTASKGHSSTPGLSVGRVQLGSTGWSFPLTLMSGWNSNQSRSAQNVACVSAISSLVIVPLKNDASRLNRLQFALMIVMLTLQSRHWDKMPPVNTSLMSSKILSSISSVQLEQSRVSTLNWNHTVTEDTLHALGGGLVAGGCEIAVRETSCEKLVSVSMTEQ